jgi:hypothetical protein
MNQKQQTESMTNAEEEYVDVFLVASQIVRSRQTFLEEEIAIDSVQGFCFSGNRRQELQTNRPTRNTNGGGGGGGARIPSRMPPSPMHHGTGMLWPL